MPIKINEYKPAPISLMLGTHTERGDVVVFNSNSSRYLVLSEPDEVGVIELFNLDTRLKVTALAGCTLAKVYKNITINLA